MTKGNLKTETFTDEQIIKGLLERMMPNNDAEKSHLEEGAARVIKNLEKVNNWNKIKTKLTAKQLLFILED